MRQLYGLCLLAATLCTRAHADAPTFQQLMDPRVLADTQAGMRVESASADDEVLSVRTTGAEFRLSGDGRGVFRQRIGQSRDLLRITLDADASTGLALTHSGPGLAFAKAEGFNLRVNGDSLFMLQARRPLQVILERAIDAGFHASWKANHVLFDEWGGFGVYCSEQEIDDAFDPYVPVTARYKLPAGAVLWIGICPPKPYDWERSLRDQVVWHWSNTSAYPPDEVLQAWSAHGNIVLLQSEVMLWKDWNLAFEPRLGAAEFARVRDSAHRMGVRFIVYTSPFYFLKGTGRERAAMNSFENFTNWPAGTPTGENIEVFMGEITKLVREHRPDGLYFDGQYTDNPAALYALARRTRALLGDEGILEWHSTNALGPDLCFLPQADAYVDFILRGEGRGSLYGDDRYLRYFVSCWNTSNSIGAICNNGTPPTAEFVRRLLRVNGRMHTIAGWLGDPGLVQILAEYRSRLTPALREEVERTAEERQKLIPETARAIAAEQQILREPPQWGSALIDERFDAMPAWTKAASELNAEPFAIAEGALSVTAKASTYAYLTAPLQSRIRGLVAVIDRGTDTGASWGPGVCLRFRGGAMLRVGLRGDGLLQADISGDQRLAPGVDCTRPVWLRVRLTPRFGSIEHSSDGRDWQRAWLFEHAGTMATAAEGVSVGKVPYHGRPEDHNDPGPIGTCRFELLQIYE